MQNGKYVNYHLVKPDKKWINDRLYFSKSVLKKYKNKIDLLKKFAIDVLSTIDSNMLIVLNKVIFMNYSDYKNNNAISKIIEVVYNGLDVDDTDDLFMPDLGDECIGFKWHDTNSIVIFVDSHISVVNQIYKGLSKNNYLMNKDFCIGIITTILHEIRHLGLECNPYLPEDKYPQKICSEEEVEYWAIYNFEKYYCNKNI